MVAHRPWQEMGWWHNICQVQGSIKKDKYCKKKCLKCWLLLGQHAIFQSLGFNTYFVEAKKPHHKMGWWHNRWLNVHCTIYQVSRVHKDIFLQRFLRLCNTVLRILWEETQNAYNLQFCIMKKCPLNSFSLILTWLLAIHWFFLWILNFLL